MHEKPVSNTTLKNKEILNVEIQFITLNQKLFNQKPEACYEIRERVSFLVYIFFQT